MSGPQAANGEITAKINGISITETAGEIQEIVVKEVKLRNLLTLTIRLLMVSRSGYQIIYEILGSQKGHSR